VVADDGSREETDERRVEREEHDAARELEHLGGVREGAKYADGEREEDVEVASERVGAQQRARREESGGIIPTGYDGAV
jgi:hypothetical protein